MRKLVNILLYSLLLAVVISGMIGIRHFIIQEEERVELETEKRLAAEREAAERDLENSASQSEDIRRVLVKKLPVYKNKKIVKISTDSGTKMLSYGDEVTVISESGLFAKIQTETGTTGYIWTDCIGALPDQNKQAEVPSKTVVIDIEGTKPEQEDSSEQDAWTWSLQIAEKLEKKLEARGYTAVMAERAAQDAVSTAKSAELANQIQADAVIHMCIAGSEAPKVSGAAAYCAPADSRYPAAECYAESAELGKYILKYYAKATGFDSAGILEEDEYPGIQRSKRPVVLFQMGNLSDKQQSGKMCRPKFQSKMAKGIADGIDAYLVTVHTRTLH